MDETVKALMELQEHYACDGIRDIRVDTSKIPYTVELYTWNGHKILLKVIEGKIEKEHSP